MTAQTILPANTLSGGYNVDNSVRMSGATVNLQRDFSGDGNRRTWTYSTWFKLSNITQSGFFNWGKGNPEFSLRFESATSDTLNNYFRVSQYDNSQIFDWSLFTPDSLISILDSNFESLVNALENIRFFRLYKNKYIFLAINFIF